MIISGVFGGFLVGPALAFVRNATAKRVSNRQQLQVHLGAPSLGSVAIGQAVSCPGAFESGDVRAVSARLLTGLPVGLTTLLVVDETDSKEASFAPLIVAASMAELGETVNVVVVAPHVPTALGSSQRSPCT